MYAQDNNSLPVWSNNLSPAYHHISINSQPFLVGIISPMLVAISQNIKFSMTEALKNWKSLTILNALKGGPSLQDHRIHFQQTTHGQGDPTHELGKMGITLNKPGQDEHVGDVECYIQT